MNGENDLSERIEKVLFGELSKEEREKAIARYRLIDAGFADIRRQIERAKSVPDLKWTIPVL